MSWRQSRLSKAMEAFISRISADGPSAKRPPHMLLELPLRLSIVLLLALLVVGCDRQKPDMPQGEASGTNQPASDAKASKIDRSHAGKAASQVQFNDPDGAKVSLADFEGKPLLLNLWATWCAPCVAEMPTLDALAARDEGLQVLAVSQDIAGQEAKVAAFFEERKLSRLEPYRDPEMEMMTALEAGVLPTTILYDSKGREVWRMVGAMDWTGDEAAKLIGEAE